MRDKVIIRRTASGDAEKQKYGSSSSYSSSFSSRVEAATPLGESVAQLPVSLVGGAPDAVADRGQDVAGETRLDDEESRAGGSHVEPGWVHYSGQPDLTHHDVDLVVAAGGGRGGGGG